MQQQQRPEGRVFPGEEEQNEVITCLALTQEFLIYGTEVRFSFCTLCSSTPLLLPPPLLLLLLCLLLLLLNHNQAGSLCYFFLADWQMVNEFHHVVGKDMQLYRHINSLPIPHPLLSLPPHSLPLPLSSSPHSRNQQGISRPH